MLKNITLSADETLIQQAREKAMRHRRSLNEIFREWLTEYAKEERQIVDYYSLMNHLNYVKAGKHFTRDELNER